MSRYFGQFETDRIIEEYFSNDKISGNCAEIGATDGINGSNTLIFEKKGWFCICVEPNPAYYEPLKRNRNIALPYACSDTDNESVDFFVYDIGNSNYSAISGLQADEKLVESHKHLIQNVTPIKVKTRTLNSILTECEFDKKFDFISIDTEGTELDVLKGFDIKKYEPTLFVIENNHNDPFIEEYLKQFNYIKDRRHEVNDFYILKK